MPININKALRFASGPFQWKPKASVRDLYNGVKGTYISPDNNWQTSDIPPYAQDAKHGYTNGPAQYFNDANLAADGGERRWEDIQLPFTISSSMAQRLCKIELLRRRHQGTGTFAFDLSMYRASALDLLQFTLPVLGWTNKLLEISGHRLTVTKQNSPGGQEVTLLGCEIDVVETDPSIYDWSLSEELTPQGYQQAALPSIGTPPQPPTNLVLASGPDTAAVGADGVARSRLRFTWTSPADGYVSEGGHLEVQYQKQGDAGWTGLQQIDPSVIQVFIEGVTDGGQYSIQIRSVNAAHVPSVWAAVGPVTVSNTYSQIRYESLLDTPKHTVNGH